MAPLPERLASARRIADGRRILATAIEQRLHTRYTFDTLRALRRRFPRVRFVWIMGADNLAQLPRWQRWLGIAATMPFVTLPRPSYNGRALASLAAQRLRPALRPARAAPALAAMPAPAWTFLHARQNPASATAIRARRVAPSAGPSAAPAAPASPQLRRAPVLATTRACPEPGQ